MTIIGIDPGLAIIGYAIVSGTKTSPKIHDYGSITTAPLEDVKTCYRLLQIYNDLEEIIKIYKPDIAVVEKIFFFKNQKTIIQVAQARGVILTLLAKYNVKLIEPTPLQVKQSITGYGKASKKDVELAVMKFFKIKERIKPDDVSDALAMGFYELK